MNLTILPDFALFQNSHSRAAALSIQTQNIYEWTCVFKLI